MDQVVEEIGCVQGPDKSRGAGSQTSMSKDRHINLAPGFSAEHLDRAIEPSPDARSQMGGTSKRRAIMKSIASFLMATVLILGGVPCYAGTSNGMTLYDSFNGKSINADKWVGYEWLSDTANRVARESVRWVEDRRLRLGISACACTTCPEGSSKTAQECLIALDPSIISYKVPRCPVAHRFLGTRLLRALLRRRVPSVFPAAKHKYTSLWRVASSASKPA